MFARQPDGPQVVVGQTEQGRRVIRIADRREEPTVDRGGGRTGELLVEHRARQRREGGVARRPEDRRPRGLDQRGENRVAPGELDRRGLVGGASGGRSSSLLGHGESLHRPTAVSANRPSGEPVRTAPATDSDVGPTT